MALAGGVGFLVELPIIIVFASGRQRRRKVNEDLSKAKFGLAAMLGSLLGIVAAPLTTSAHSLTEEGAPPPWEPVLSGALGPLFTFASPEVVYATYGKLYLFVFLGLLSGLIGLHARRRDRAGRLERWGFYLSFAGLALNLFGNVFDYWYGGGVGESTPDFLGFLLGTVLGMLILVIGSAMLGIGLLRAGDTPRVGAWLLVLALPGIIALSFLGFGNIPSGPALWFCFTWLALGHSLRAG